MILITGAPGFLGRQITRRLLQADPGATLGLLVRETPAASAVERVKALLKDLFGHVHQQELDRIEVIPGDLSKEDFGLGHGAFRQLARRVKSIYHCAANTALNQTVEEGRSANLRSTLEVLRLAEIACTVQKRLIPFFHISTAYVAGDAQHVVKPDELDLTRRFRNGYEQSKAESEAEIRKHSSFIDAVTFRPSIIVGDSKTGITSAFNVIYIPARFLVQGLLKVVPASPSAPFDIVPVDYVADAVVSLSRKPDRQARYFHLCAGVGRESNPLEILEHVISAVHKHGRQSLRRLSPPAIINPEIILRRLTTLPLAQSTLKQIERLLHWRGALLGQILPFIPYMAANPRFDVSQTVSELEGLVEPAPLFQTYAENLFKYCLDTNWGKQLPAQHS